jgi:hypothetical protein
MAGSDERIMALVEKELAANPRAGSRELFDKARAAVPSAADLNIRQFHARYPLQVKRRQSLKESARSRRRSRTASRRQVSSAGRTSRDQVRAIFLRFAEDLSGADQRSDLVRVLASVDQYVDEAVKAASG